MTSGVTIIQFGLDLKVTKKLQFFKIFQAKISIFFIELPLTGKSCRCYILYCVGILIVIVIITPIFLNNAVGWL